MRRVAVLLAMTVLMFPMAGVPAAGGSSADQAVVKDCTEEAFDVALAAVQSNGGGTITFTCDGTIAFTSQKLIGSTVRIFGGGVVIDGGANTRHFVVGSTGSLELVGVVLQGGRSSEYGGSIRNNGGTVIVDLSEFRFNEATRGGAIANFSGGRLLITDSRFTSNSAGVTGLGGAILNQDTPSTVYVTGSTFNENYAQAGGAINNRTGTTNVIASTFYRNTGRLSGGAIYNSTAFLAGDAYLTVTASTFSDNSAAWLGASLFTSAAVTEIQSSIIARGVGEDNCHGPMTSHGANLSDDGSCSLTAAGDSENNGSINLGALAENGGPTPTVLPGPGSSALGAAPCVLSSEVQGQRGVRRPPINSTNCDIGAAETSGLVPLRLEAVHNASGPVDEGSPVHISALLYGPPTGIFSASANCGVVGISPTISIDKPPMTVSCQYADELTATVGIQVCWTTPQIEVCVADSADAVVQNTPPTVATPIVAPEPSDEGASVVATATFSDPGVLDTHTCAVDYGDGDGPQPGTVTAQTCTGPVHIYADDDPSGTPSDPYPVTVVVTDVDGGIGENTFVHTVVNVAPVINAIATNGPVPQGQPAEITVGAEDAGIDDVLLYGFDCDGDGSHETPGTGNVGICSLDPSSATSVVGIEVSDDDGGVTSATVEIEQTLALCASDRRPVSLPAEDGTCPTASSLMVVPADGPTTFCTTLPNGPIAWSSEGTCAGGQMAHVIPVDGPLPFCANSRTGILALRAEDGCGLRQVEGVIPGD